MQSKLGNPLSSLKGLLLDMDGVIYCGDVLLPGVADLLAFLPTVGIRYCMVTNNSQRTAAQYAEKLRRLGVSVPEYLILTSGGATADYLIANAKPGSSVLVIGRDGLTIPLTTAGFHLTDQDPEYVVVGLDTGFSYDKLSLVCRAIWHGARFIATNRDATMPTESGLFPGNGALVAAIEATTGVHPITVGKPEPTMLRVGLQRIGVSATEAAMLGDRIETDVIAAERAGMTSMLVLTGVTSREACLKSDTKPDFVFRDLNELRMAIANGNVDRGGCR